MSGRGRIGVRALVLGGCLLAAAAAQESETQRRTYELVLPRARVDHGARFEGSPADQAAGGGAAGGVLSFDEREDSTFERLEERLDQILRAANLTDELSELNVQSYDGLFVVDVEGSAAHHKVLSKELPRLQRALDAATLRFRVRLLRADPGGPAVELAQLRLQVQDGDEGEAHVIQSRPWQFYEVDQTGAFPRLRPTQVTMNEGFLVRLRARRAVGDAVRVRARVQQFDWLPSPQVVAVPAAGELQLPAFERFSAESSLRARPGQALTLATSTGPAGGRVWLELQLAPAEGEAPPPLLRDVCLELDHGVQPDPSVGWYDDLDPRPSAVRGGAGSFSFEEEERGSSLVNLLLDTLRIEHERWVLPAARQELATVTQTLEAWEAAHPTREVELAWGAPSKGTQPPMSAKALPLSAARRIALTAIEGQGARVDLGREGVTLEGLVSVVGGPEGEEPQRVDTPYHGTVWSGARIALSALADGVVALRWNLADPAQREVVKVGGHPLTQDARWSWQGEAELQLDGQAWILVGEAQRPDGELVALYGRFAKGK